MWGAPTKDIDAYRTSRSARDLSREKDGPALAPAAERRLFPVGQVARGSKRGRGVPTGPGEPGHRGRRRRSSPRSPWVRHCTPGLPWATCPARLSCALLAAPNPGHRAQVGCIQPPWVPTYAFHVPTRLGPPLEVARGPYLGRHWRTSPPPVLCRPSPQGNLTSILLVGAISSRPEGAGNGSRRPSGPKNKQPPSCPAA